VHNTGRPCFVVGALRLAICEHLWSEKSAAGDELNPHPLLWFHLSILLLFCEVVDLFVLVSKAVLKVHPNWCVGEKRIRNLNRLLNDLKDNEFSRDENNPCSDGLKDRRDDLEWEEIRCDFAGDKDWILVEIPGDL
jgi:hypothetical protein